MLQIIYCILFLALVQSRKYFVDVNRINTFNSSTDDGLKWNVAFPSLENAFASILERNDKSAQIWMMEGTYIPATIYRDGCFKPPTGVTIMGGFTDKSQKYPSDRPTDSFSTISGDIGVKNDNSDNCYHVITYTKKLILDRVIIANGNANYDADDSYTNQELALHRYGGALITFDSTAKIWLELTQVYFVNNTAIAGGALWFSSNPSTPVDVSIKRCVFDNNKALAGQYDGGYGGSIYFYFLADLNIEDTNFTNNYADFRGGAIYLDYGGKLDISDSYFINNQAGGYGGAIFSEDRNSQTNGTFPTITTSYFIDNEATLYGGAICYINYVQGEITDTQFIRNTAGSLGGAICLFNSTIDPDVFDSTVNNDFKDNVATDDTTSNDLFVRQDAVEYDDLNDWPAVADINDYWNQLEDVWNNNQFELGEEDPVTDFKYKDAEKNSIHYCLVDWDNTNEEYPTGEKWGEAYTEIQACLDQLKTRGGGEIWVTGDDDDVKRRGTYKPTRVPLWKENMLRDKGLPITQPNERSFEMYDNIAIYGGFKGKEDKRNERNPFAYKTYLSGDLGVLSNGKQTYANQLLMSADNTIIDGFIFIDAGYGPLLMNEGGGRRRRLKNSISVQIVLDTRDPFAGAGIFANSTNVLIQNSIFYRLFAENKGGAMYCIGQEGDAADNIFKYPTIKNVAFIENRANLRGGAISADIGCDFECKWCIFDGNECAQKGGAIYLDFASSPLITKSRFVNNSALGGGGCIAADGRSMVIIQDTKFRNNSAVWEGACLYSGSGVGKNSLQGYDIGAYDFPISDVFGPDNDINANKLLQNHVGFNNMYGWPMSTLSVTDISPAPTPKPSTAPTVQGLISNNPQPNFVIFIVDDMVYTEALGSRIDSPFFPIPDLAPSSSESIIDIELPNISRFIHSSVVFPRTYSGPKCSPSRFAVLTGRSPAQSQYAMSKSYTASPMDPKGIEGTKVTVPFSRISVTTTDAIYNIPAVLKNAGYITGMIGKWHLMDKDDYPTSNGITTNCDLLNNGGVDDLTADIPYIYTQCKSVVEDLGFSFVDGYFHSNIETNDYFTHNPEWMQYQVKKFIDLTKNKINSDKPYFLYVAPTLTHDPSILDALTEYTISQTPAGNTFGNDLSDKDLDKYIYKYMRTRGEIYAQALAWQTLDGSSDEDTLNKAAGLLWVDEQFGAMLRTLKDKGKDIENTMIILINDHGMGAKGLLYEQGIRIMQSISYPQLFGQKWWKDDLDKHKGYVLPHDFITSTLDYANVMFSLAGITPPQSYYTKSSHFNRYYWLEDVLNYISYIDKGLGNEYESNGLPKMTCCTNRTIDVYNSHAIVTKKHKYFYRTTTEVESIVTPQGETVPSPEALMYSSLTDTEQIYDLEFDSSEQENLINNITNISSNLGIALFLYRIQMIDYIFEESCLADDIVDCEYPLITSDDIPPGYEYKEQTPSPTYYGYNCQRFIEYNQRFPDVKSFRESRDGYGYRNKTEFRFLNKTFDKNAYGNECGESFVYDKDLGVDVIPNGIEYFYSFTKNGRILDLTMLVCCMGTFGPQFQVDSLQYDPFLFNPNEVLLEKYPNDYAFNFDDVLETENGIGVKAIVVINVLCFICVIGLIIGGVFYWYRKKEKQHEIKINELNLVINNKETKNKPKKDTITKQQKKGIEMAGYNEMESSRDSDLSDIESQQIDTNNKAINKTVAEATGGLSPVPGSPAEVIVTNNGENGNNITKPY